MNSDQTASNPKNSTRIAADFKVDFKKLDSISKRFGKFLFRVFPDWKRYFLVKPFDEKSLGGYLVVDVPVPVEGLKFIPDDKDSLRISSDTEIIVSFDYYHDHFGIFADEEENFHRAVEFIKLLMKEEICVAAVFKDDKCQGSKQVKAGEKPDLSKFTNLTNGTYQVFIRSWNGTYNRKYTKQL